MTEIPAGMHRRAGVLQVEALAQLGGIMMMDPENKAAQKNFFFGGIEACKFRKPVVPGDVLVAPSWPSTMLWFTSSVCRALLTRRTCR